MYLLDFFVCFLLCLTHIVTISNAHQYASAVGYQFTVLDRCAHVENQSIKVLRSCYLCAFGIRARIAL